MGAGEDGLGVPWGVIGFYLGLVVLVKFDLDSWTGEGLSKRTVTTDTVSSAFGSRGDCQSIATLRGLQVESGDAVAHRGW